MLVAGIDCSTQSTKVLVVDADTGAVVAEGRAEHVVTGTDGARETDPGVWWEALATAFAQTGRAGDVEAVAVGGQQHGLVVVDADERPLRPAPLWNDTRSAPQAAELVERFGADWWAGTVGSVPLAAFAVTTWAWLLANEPRVARDAVGVRLPHDWLNARLTGRPVTDRGDASGTGWWSTHSDGYVDEVLDAVHLPAGALPLVVSPDRRAGEVTDAAAAALGLRRGVTVAPGTGDNMAAALGLGLGPGEAVISLGTSGTAYAVTETPSADPSGVVAGFADATGRFLPLACTLNATLAVDRVADWLGLDRDEVAPASAGAVVVPFFDGERTPNLPDAAASIHGLRHTTTPGQILRSAYEGAALSLVDALPLLGADTDGPVTLVGGGARGATWPRVVADLSGRQVVVPDATELVALGAAAQAAAVVAGADLTGTARGWNTRTGTVVDPEPLDPSVAEGHRTVRAALGA